MYGLVFTQAYCRSSPTASLVVHGCIMLFGGIDVFVSQNICNQIDITGFLIKGSTISASKLMRCNFLGSGNLGCIFFYQIFHSLDANTFPLSGEKEGELPEQN